MALAQNDVRPEAYLVEQAAYKVPISDVADTASASFKNREAARVRVRRGHHQAKGHARHQRGTAA